MSTVYNPESETIAMIERLELEARDLRRKVERAIHPEDRRTLNRLLLDIKKQIECLRSHVS